MNRFAILGSGFGLYGYLPALVSCGQQLVLPERYRSRFEGRVELASFADKVEWREENTVLEGVKGVVLALPPKLQCDWLTRCLKHAHIEHLLLEKPLAPSPEMASLLLDQLIHSRKTFRIGYTFRYTSWAKHLLATIKNANEASKFSIQWFFMAHHFRHQMQTWKRSSIEGGGVLRFYGIHIIALLAEIGYDQVIFSQISSSFKGEDENWSALFRGEGLPECEVVIDSKSPIKQFQITQRSHSADKLILTDLQDPFDQGSPVGLQEAQDQRVPLLSQLCHSLWEPVANEYDWYVATIKLWSSVEDKMLFQDIKEVTE